MLKDVNYYLQDLGLVTCTTYWKADRTEVLKVLPKTPAFNFEHRSLSIPTQQNTKARAQL